MSSDSLRGPIVVAGLTAVGIAALYNLVFGKKKNNIRWEKVGEVDQLFVYPVKSARGVEVKKADAGLLGLAQGKLKDRVFVVYTEEGAMVTSRTAPMMATIITDVIGNVLHLVDLSGSQIKVDIQQVVKKGATINMRMREVDSCGLDCGDEVAEWLTKRLFPDNTKVRLLYGGNMDVKRIARKPPYFEFPKFKKSDKIIYSDTTAYMIQTTASLADLNSNLTSPVDMGWYRPNIIVSGTEAWDEDSWSYVKIGDVVLRVVKPCERCYLTTISPEDGQHKPEALDALKKYRVPKYPPNLAKEWKFKPIQGLHCCIDQCAEIKVGDQVSVARELPSWRV